MINLSDKQKQDILEILKNYSKPTWKEYRKTSDRLGLEKVKKIDIKGLQKVSQDGWHHPLYQITDSEIELPEGYALHYLGHGLVSLQDAAVHLYCSIYNGDMIARNWIKENLKLS